MRSKIQFRKRNCNFCHHKSNCGSCHAQQDSGSLPGVGLPGIAEYHDDNKLSSCLPFHSVAPDPTDVDDDGDGVTENQGDFDDTDESIFPGVAEVCGDGIDQDCDGSDLMCPPDTDDEDAVVRIEEVEWEAH